MFMFLCSFKRHEQRVADIARELGFLNISLSSQVIPMIKAVPRGFTGESPTCFAHDTALAACADAYLTPVIQQYIDGFRRGFEDELRGTSLEFMQSDGGLCPVEK